MEKLINGKTTIERFFLPNLNFKSKSIRNTIMKTLINTLIKTLTLISLATVLFLATCINNSAQAEETINDHPMIAYTNTIIEQAKASMEAVADIEYLAAHVEALETQVEILTLQVEHFIHHDGDVEFGEKTIVESSVFNFSKLVDAIEINEFEETCDAIIDFADMAEYTCVEL